MIDVTKASREALEEYVLSSEAVEVDESGDEDSPQQARFRAALTKLRAECAAPKLRSREQVNADMAVIIRAWNGAAGGMVYAMPNSSMTALQRLCAEPTAEEPDGKTLTLTTDIEALAKSLRETLNPSELVMLADLIDPTAGKEPAELDLAEHEATDQPPPRKDPCGCQASDELRERVKELAWNLSVATNRRDFWRSIAAAREDMYDKLKTAIEALDQ